MQLSPESTKSRVRNSLLRESAGGKEGEHSGVREQGLGTQKHITLAPFEGSVSPAPTSFHLRIPTPKVSTAFPCLFNNANDCHFLERSPVFIFHFQQPFCLITAHALVRAPIEMVTQVRRNSYCTAGPGSLLSAGLNSICSSRCTYSMQTSEYLTSQELCLSSFSQRVNNGTFLQTHLKLPYVMVITYVCIHVLSGYMFFLINYNFNRGIRSCLKKKKKATSPLASLRSVLIPLKSPSVNVPVTSQPNENSKKPIGKAKYEIQNHMSMKLRCMLINLPGLPM